MLRFIHAADIHLDSPLLGLERYEGAPVEQLRGATRQAFDNLVQLAIRERVAFVLIAGDLYDGNWRDHNTGLYFVNQISRLREHGIAVYLIAGNHDAANKMTRSLRLPPNPSGDSPLLDHNAAETRVLDDLGVAIHGHSFANASVADNLARMYPDAIRGLFNIGLLHTSLEGDAQHDPYAPCTCDDLRARQYQYWALGHIHQRRVIVDDPFVGYCGNVQGRHIRESGPKGCWLVTVDDRQRVTTDFQPLDVVRWEVCDVDCAGAEDGDEVLGRARHALGTLASSGAARNWAVRVQLRGACSAHAALAARPSDWTAEIRAAAIDVSQGSIWVEKVRFETAPPPRARRFAEGPVEELLAYLAQLHEDPQQLEPLVSELESLHSKLPSEVLSGPEAPALKDPDWLREIVRQVEPLLMERLTAREER